MKRPPQNDSVVHVVTRRKDMDMLKNLVELGANINDVNVSLMRHFRSLQKQTAQCS
jgi:hypothetical protein